MKSEYDLARLESRGNPYAARLNKPVTPRDPLGIGAQQLASAPAINTGTLGASAGRARRKPGPAE
jgi:hypothetical protein